MRWYIKLQLWPLSPGVTLPAVGVRLPGQRYSLRLRVDQRRLHRGNIGCHRLETHGRGGRGRGGGGGRRAEVGDGWGHQLRSWDGRGGDDSGGEGGAGGGRGGGGEQRAVEGDLGGGGRGGGGRGHLRGRLAGG